MLRQEDFQEISRGQGEGCRSGRGRSLATPRSDAGETREEAGGQRVAWGVSGEGEKTLQVSSHQICVLHAARYPVTVLHCG